MTDNEIERVSECLKGEKSLCNSCSYGARYPDCKKYAIRDILNLINRQKAEIERLNGENKAFGEIIKKQDDEISVLRKDLLKREDLEKSFSKSVKQFDKKLAKTVKLERAEAYKEFAERLKETANSRMYRKDVVYIVEIDILLEKKAGENNG